MNDTIYKVVPRQEWEESVPDGAFQGSPVDLSDGYIHFSTKDQLDETMKKHFAGQTDLLLIEVSTKQVSNALRWEPSRNGDLFPHLYGALPIEAVVSVKEV